MLKDDNGPNRVRLNRPEQAQSDSVTHHFASMAGVNVLWNYTKKKIFVELAFFTKQSMSCSKTLTKCGWVKLNFWEVSHTGQGLCRSEVKNTTLFASNCLLLFFNINISYDGTASSTKTVCLVWLSWLMIKIPISYPFSFLTLETLLWPKKKISCYRWHPLNKITIQWMTEFL